MEIGDSGLFCLSRKLKTLKISLRERNKNVFGKMDVHICTLEQKIEDLENDLLGNASDDVELDLLTSKVELDMWMCREETQLRQMVNSCWLKQGEASASFFHALKSITIKKIDHMKLVDGKVLSSPEEVHIGAVEYFENFLKSRPRSSRPNLSSIIEASIVEEENFMIFKVPSMEEVKDALFSIPIDSSPRPNGFGASFY